MRPCDSYPQKLSGTFVLLPVPYVRRTPKPQLSAIPHYYHTSLQAGRAVLKKDTWTSHDPLSLVTSSRFYACRKCLRHLTGTETSRRYFAESASFTSVYVTTSKNRRHKIVCIAFKIANATLDTCGKRNACYEPAMWRHSHLSVFYCFPIGGLLAVNQQRHQRRKKRES